MIQGIALLGLNGSGKSTLAHALAKHINYYEMDVEDYYFPEQVESRKWALENKSIVETIHLGELPFSSPRTKGEVEEALWQDIRSNPKFIISGVTMNWNERIMDRIDSAFWIQTPVHERVKRVQAREERRFGSRVLEGGDMYEQQLEFRNIIENRNEQMIEASIKRLKCPVIVIDGTQSVTYNLKQMIETMRAMQG